MLWYVIAVVCLAAIVGVAQGAKNKPWRIPATLGLFVLLLVSLFKGYRTFNVSSSLMEERQGTYAEIGGRGLAQDLQKRFPGKRWLVVLPAKGDALSEGIYKGFKQGLGGGSVSVVEIPFALPEADLKKMSIAAVGDASLVSSPEQLLAKPVVSEMLTAAMFQRALGAKTAEAEVIIGFAGLPRGKEVATLSRALKGKILVVINGDCGMLEDGVRAGQVVALTPWTSDPEIMAKSVPGDFDKAFKAYWRLVTVETANAAKTEGLFTVPE